jgi:hypothetical protein
LLAQLQAALPLPARAMSELAAMLKRNISPMSVTAAIAAVRYAGDEGGIMRRLEIQPHENAVHVSITPLRFDPRLSNAREITPIKTPRKTPQAPKVVTTFRGSHADTALTSDQCSD